MLKDYCHVENTHAHARTQAHARTHAHTHTHTRTHAHTHARTPALKHTTHTQKTATKLLLKRNRWTFYVLMHPFLEEYSPRNIFQGTVHPQGGKI